MPGRGWNLSETYARWRSSTLGLGWSRVLVSGCLGLAGPQIHRSPLIFRSVPSAPVDLRISLLSHFMRIVRELGKIGMHIASCAAFVRLYDVFQSAL
jgi:hypothetical protein